MRIAHFADLHIGFSHLNYRDESGRNLRQVDFEKAALAAAKKAIAEEVDVAIIAGDFLHDTNMYPAALSGAVSFCQLFKESGIPLLAIGGNHDEAEGQGRYNGLRFLQKHHGLQLFLEQSHLDLESLRFHFVSFRVLSRAASGRGELNPFPMREDGKNVLVTHGYAPGKGVPEIPEGSDVEIPAEWLAGKFDLALLGHIHHHGEIAPGVFYAGSSERRNFGEVGERPGFYIHEMDDSIDSQSIFIDQLEEDLPRGMFSYEIETDGLTARELDKKVLELLDRLDLEGSLFRLLLNSVSPDLDKSKSQSLWEREFKKRGGLHFESLARTKQMEELLSIEFSKAPSDIVRGFVDFIDEGDSDLKEEAASVMAEAREKIMAQESD